QTGALIDGWHDPEVWSTGRVAPRQQFDCWRSFVVDAHMRWDIRPFACDRFPAFIRQGRFDGFRVTHLTSEHGGIVGTRSAREVAQDDEAFYNLIYIAEGSIELEIGERALPLHRGHFALWDTTRPMRFTTGKDLRQITFAVPQTQLRKALPRADDYVGHIVDAQAGLARTFAARLLALDEGFGALPPMAASAMVNQTTELLATTLSARVPLTASRGSFALLRQLMNYIEGRLDDPELGTHTVARENGISERHLHRLFDGLRTTPAGWIRQRRLERCRREIVDARGASITNIAYRWGFRDSGTFSKIFRREFGICPRELRAGRGRVADRGTDRLSS
ncbi:MAG: helix-turn-helix domain-containing protein, partial [Panacagrimonas sp.]